MKKMLKILLLCACVMCISTLVCAQGEEGCAHNYGEWNTRKAPTCTANGERVRICGSCGDVQKESISATGHSYGEWNTKKAATCTANGERVRICGSCGDVQTETISATGHSYGEWKIKKAATCTAEGTRARTCKKCGDEQTETIDKLAHTPEVVVGKAATCTEDGLTDGEKCSVCNEILTEQQVAPAAGHQYESTKIAATTSSEGYTLHTCALCGDTYKDSWVAKLRTKKVKKAAPARTAAPKAEVLDSIVTDAEGNPLQYADYTEPHESDCDLLVITADMDADAANTIRNLHLSPELLANLKSDGVGCIRFVVGDAAVEFSLDMFESEEIALILQNMESEFMGYVISVNPDAQNAENELSCQVQVYLATADASEEDITAFAQGMKLIVGENTIDIAAN